MTDLDDPLLPSTEADPHPLPRNEPVPDAEDSADRSALMPTVAAVSAGIHLLANLPQDEAASEEDGKRAEPKDEHIDEKKVAKKVEKEKRDLLEGEPNQRLYASKVGEFLAHQNYGDGETTHANFDRLIEFYLSVFESKQEAMHFIDAVGNELLTSAFPPNWFSDIPTGETKTIEVSEGKGKKRRKVKKTVPVVIPKMTDAEKNTFQNELRATIADSEKIPAKDFKSPGYPLLATAVIPGTVVNGEKENSLMAIILERLKEDVHCPGVGTPQGPRHLEGKTMPLYEAILRIADAYDIPHAIALGIGANESGYDKDGPVSSADAYGIFQIQSSGNDAKPAAYEMARKYAKRHPEFSGKIRKGELKNFKESFHGVVEYKNRLVQAEMFCAYFRFIQDELRETVEALELRLQTLDPSYLMGTLSMIAPITAYNAGAGGIKKDILRFLKLSNTEMLDMIGTPPYGIDVWQAVLANSYDRVTQVDAKGKVLRTSGQRTVVLTYAAKVLAMGSRIMQDQNILEGIAKHGQGTYQPSEGRTEAPGSPDAQVVDKVPSAQNRVGMYAAYFATALASILTGVRAGKQTREGLREEGITRRNLLMGAAALAGVATPVARAVANVIEFGEHSAEPGQEVVLEGPESMPYPVYADVLTEGRERLQEIYKKLKAEGLSVEQPLATEDNRKRANWKTPERVAKLKPLMQKAFGEEWDDYYTGKALPNRFFTTQQEKQSAYLKAALASGDTVPIKESDPSQPFFCQQVGEDSGITNNPDSLYVHKEMLPVMGTLIALVNDQIDAFNADPKSFGMNEAEFPKIPHILSIKVSGAHRNVNDRHAGSTPSFSDHWTDTCLDMIALSRSEGAGVFKFKEALIYKGETLVPAGGMVPTQGHPQRTREIVMTMIERALFVLEDSLKGKPGRPEIMPRFEGTGSPYHSNWHVGIVPSSIANPIKP